MSESMSVMVFVACCLIGVAIGAFVTFAYHVIYLTRRVDGCLDEMDLKIDEFNDVTKKASEANQSHGKQIITFDVKIRDIEERMSRLDSSIRMNAKSSPVWKK